LHASAFLLLLEGFSADAGVLDVDAAGFGEHRQQQTGRGQIETCCSATGMAHLGIVTRRPSEVRWRRVLCVAALLGLLLKQLLEQRGGNVVGLLEARDIDPLIPAARYA
jgi:hypothetical protein